MSGFPINFDARSFEEELANKPQPLLDYPALTSPKMDGAAPLILKQDYATQEARVAAGLALMSQPSLEPAVPLPPALTGEEYLVGRGINPDHPISEELLDILVPKDSPKLPFVPNNADEERIIRLARQNMAVMMIVKEWERAKSGKPAPRPVAPQRIIGEPALPPASREDLLDAAIRAMTAAVKEGSALNCTVPDSWFAGIKLSINVDSVEEKADMEHVAAKFRSLGAKVAFQIGALYQPGAKVSSFRTKGGNARISEEVIRILKTPIVRELMKGPSTIEHLMAVLQEGGYDRNTYFNVHQMLHALGCTKQPGPKDPSARGPRYVWALPTQEDAG